MVYGEPTVPIYEQLLYLITANNFFHLISKVVNYAVIKTP